MTTLDRYFEKFHSQIALDQGRVDRIKSAHTTLRANVEADGPLSRVLRSTFLQGSYAQSTAIRPAENTEFDVDVVLAIDATEPSAWSLDPKRSPEKVIDWVATRLRTCPQYEGRVRRHGRCVRVSYAREFHMDVVPAHAPDGGDRGLQVPDAKTSEWIKSHPKGYLDWCTDRNRVSNGRFVRVTKFLKWWRDNRLPAGARPKSIILQTMIGQNLPSTSTTDAEVLTRVLAQIQRRFGPSRFFFSTPDVMNPSIPGENLAKSWDEDSAFRFGECARKAAQQAEAALAEPQDDRSARLWQQVFGDGFPARG